ncbi:hypothetical protein [Asticcacaulis sp. 201]|nr:hypothetical protein [Asticcacaulis sp. 201]MDV6333055.1 hypothetical protein [Asticcacaulis sp. 201]
MATSVGDHHNTRLWILELLAQGLGQGRNGMRRGSLNPGRDKI